MYRRWIDSSEEPRRMQEWINMAVVEFEPIAPGRLLPAGTREEIAETVTSSMDIQDVEDKILVTLDVPGVEKSP